MSRAALLGRPRALAAPLAAVTFLALAALAGAPGVSRDEARAIAGGAAADARGAVLAPLAAAVPRGAHALLSRAGLSHVRAARLGTAAHGALLSALLALLGSALGGAPAALLAVALFWLAPRHLHAGLVATPDLAAAALALAVAWAWQRARRARTRPAAARDGVVTGLLLAAALATRLDAWVLALALALHAALAPRLAASRAPRPAPAGAQDGSPPPPRPGSGAPVALAAALVVAPSVLAAGWPWLWADPLRRLGAALASPLARAAPGPLATAVLTLPVATLAVLAGGVLHALARVLRAAREPGSVRDADLDLLLLLAAAAPVAAAALGLAAPGAGVRPVLPAMPFLALLGARALVAAADAAWPARGGTLLAAAAALVLAPSLRATVHAFPAGASAWSELAGGAPGAASRGFPRQDGGEAVVAALDAVNARAAAGARLWLPRTAPAAVALLAADGRLRPDLSPADDLASADVAIVAIDGEGRDDEYRAWAALRTAHASAGVYLDQVPLVLVYARAGAWR